MRFICSMKEGWRRHKHIILVLSLLVITVIIMSSTTLSTTLERYFAGEPTKITSTGDFVAMGQFEETEMSNSDVTFLPAVPKKTKPLNFLKLSTMKLPKFDGSFKNPCWHERYDNKDYFRCFPYFYIAGFPKCGTTDIFSRVVSHPLVIAGIRKETHYLARKFYRSPRTKCLSKFHCGSVHFSSNFFGKASQLIAMTNDTKFLNSTFTELGNMYSPSRFLLRFMQAFPVEFETIWKEGQKFKKYPGITVDASVSTVWEHRYFRSIAENKGYDYPRNTSADWIRKMYPGAKIIIILRNPAIRALSVYKMHLKFQAKRQHWRLNESRWRADPWDFHKQVQLTIRQMEQCLGSGKPALLCTTYQFPVTLEPGLYYYHIKTLFEKFPRKQILILKFEDYIANVPKTLEKVYMFLDLPSISEEGLEFIGQNEIMNEAWAQGDMLEETKALLTKFYEPFNEKLAKFMDDDRFLWHA